VLLGVERPHMARDAVNFTSSPFLDDHALGACRDASDLAAQLHAVMKLERGSPPL
jgi:hypothetical protein